MPKEQEVIEYFKKQIDICLKNAEICDDNNFDEEATYLREESYMLETVLNMLKEKDKKIDSKNRLLQIVGIELNEAEIKIEEKDKIIDLMAEQLEGVPINKNIPNFENPNLKEYITIFTNKEDIKQYFEQKSDK